MLQFLGFHLSQFDKNAKRCIIFALQCYVIIFWPIITYFVINFVLQNFIDLVMISDDVNNITVGTMSYAKLLALFFLKKSFMQLLRDMKSLNDQTNTQEFQLIENSSENGIKLTKLLFTCSSFVGSAFFVKALYHTIVESKKTFPSNIS